MNVIICPTSFYNYLSLFIWQVLLRCNSKFKYKVDNIRVKSPTKANTHLHNGGLQF